MCFEWYCKIVWIDGKYFDLAGDILHKLTITVCPFYSLVLNKLLFLKPFLNVGLPM